MLKATEKVGNPACKHNWVKRDKKTIQILSRACTECGQVEFHSENEEIDEATINKIMRGGK